MNRFFAITIALWLCLQMYGVAGAESGVDVVTMKNGDIFNGTVDKASFTLTTHYGKVSIPDAQVAELHFGKTPQVIIITQGGAHYSGTLTEKEILIQRALHQPLPLAFTDIAEISIAPRKSRRKRRLIRDTVEALNGDLFHARIATTDFILKAPDSIQMLNRSRIFLMEFMQSEEEGESLVQVTLNSGAKLQGQLMTRRIQAEDRFGNHLELGIGGLNLLAFQVNHQPDTFPGYNYRKRIAPSTLIRDRLRDGTPGPEMIALRGGEFRRGDLQGDGDGDEQPPKLIALKPFAIGLYEVTFDEYDRFCDSTGKDKPDDADWGRGRHPVVNVSWDSATAYTDWLSQQTGQRYRLPTDAEWEYAARGGTGTRFWWGNDIGFANANCAGCSSIWDGAMTSRVGSFGPNPYGLHDTAGNVFEWVADCWNDTFETAPGDGSALEKPNCGIRVIRGGAWSFPPKEVRSANRWRDFHPRRSDDTGFRLVRELGGE